MSLQGSLETFSLPDVLTLLSSTKKSGELRVVGGPVDGRVWFHQGQVVHSAIGGKAVPAVDAVWELLRLDAGTFSFGIDAKAPKEGDPQVVDMVLADAQARLAEWRQIAEVVPHLDCVVDMAPEAPGDEVIVAAAQWKLLVAVAGGRSVRQLMERTATGEFDCCKAVKELIDASLATIDVSAPKRAAEGKGAPVAPPPPSPEAVASAPAPPAAPSDTVDKKAADDLVNRPRVRATTPTPASTEMGKSGEPKPAAAGLNGSGNANGNGSAKPSTDDGSADAKELVAQLAALGVDEEDEEIRERVAQHLAKGGELPQADGDEPINRGLLLKFLSSVRN